MALEVFTISFLSAQVIGFASLNALGQNGTTGGAGGQTVTVTTEAALLDYLDRTEPYIIRISGMISLSPGMYDIKSDKTVIGIGDNSGISGGGFNIGLAIDDAPASPPADAVHNIIIRNLTFENVSDDCLNVMMFSHHVWIDHNTFLSTADGACDIKRGSNYCTVSYNHFSNIGKTCLLGHADGSTYEAQDSGRLKVTYHHNWFDKCNSRMPRVRYGECHLFNNYYSNVGDYAIGIGIKSRIYSESNYLENGAFSQIYVDDGGLKDIGSYLTGNYKDYILLPNPVTWNPRSYYDYTLDPAQSVKSIVMANAGVGKAGLPSSQPTLPPTAQPTPPSGTKGDANNDGRIDIIDALMVAQYSVGLVTPNLVTANADVNCSGKIDILDALQIAQYYIGLISIFPGCGSV